MCVHDRLLFQLRAQRFDLMYSWFCANVYVWISVVCVCACVRNTLMYSRSSSLPDQIAQLRAGCCEIQTRRALEGSEAASDVFLDGLNNECLKRLRRPQLPKLRPCSLTLTCLARCEEPEKEGRCRE